MNNLCTLSNSLLDKIPKEEDLPNLLIFFFLVVLHIWEKKGKFPNQNTFDNSQVCTNIKL